MRYFPDFSGHLPSKIYHPTSGAPRRLPPTLCPPPTPTPTPNSSSDKNCQKVTKIVSPEKEGEMESIDNSAVVVSGMKLAL